MRLEQVQKQLQREKENQARVDQVAKEKREHEEFLSQPACPSAAKSFILGGRREIATATLQTTTNANEVNKAKKEANKARREAKETKEAARLSMMLQAGPQGRSEPRKGKK